MSTTRAANAGTGRRHFAAGCVTGAHGARTARRLRSTRLWFTVQSRRCNSSVIRRQPQQGHSNAMRGSRLEPCNLAVHFGKQFRFFVRSANDPSFASERIASVGPHYATLPNCAMAVLPILVVPQRERRSQSFFQSWPRKHFMFELRTSELESDRIRRHSLLVLLAFGCLPVGVAESAPFSGRFD